MARPGNVGFISQSGALCTAVLDWSFHENVGFSHFVSIGSMLDVNWGDLIYYLGNDTRTQSIVIYMESIGDARSFMSAAREVALTKPIIVIKAGRTAAAAKAARAEAEVPHLLLIDPEGHPLGWLSDRDLAGETVPSKADTSPDPILDRDDVMRDALSDLLRAGTQFAPVVDRRGRVEGVLSVEIISDFLASPAARTEDHPAAERPG